MRTSASAIEAAEWMPQSKDALGHGSYESSFIAAGVLLLVGAALTFLIKSAAKKT